MLGVWEFGRGKKGNNFTKGITKTNVKVFFTNLYTKKKTRKNETSI